MAYEPLHHKYRPQTFADLVGQEAIATTLTNALLSERIAPAYLFTGPRGTGKTSSARILAKSLNCAAGPKPTPTPCGQCEICQAITRGSALDVIEIDAASNTGVDNIREIIERSQFAPVQCRFKVYVIDECLTGDTLVLTKQGLVRIDNPALQGQDVLSFNEQSATWEYKKVLRWLNQGRKATLIIKTRNSSIRCTANHLIRTETGWIKAQNLAPGMKILSPANVVVDNLSKNTAPMDGSDVLPEDTNSMAINTAKKFTISMPFWLKQKKTVPFASVDVESGSQIYENTPSLPWHTNFEIVESILPAENETVYDLEVADNHNFVANGLLVHNCHMLSTAAFNALLKTLEEPPDRVIFVLATTDPQRVLPTIISRCQRFDYRRIPLPAMVKHLRNIADQESININDEAVTLVAQMANGGLRDAESLLDQLSLLAGTVTPEKVWDLVGAVPEQDLLALLTAIASNQPEKVIDCCRQLLNRGREPLIVLQNLAAFYLNLLIAKSAPQRSDLVAVTAGTWEQLCQLANHWDTEVILAGQQRLKESEFQLRNSTQPRLWLEVTLLNLIPDQIPRLEKSLAGITPPKPPTAPPQTFSSPSITPSVTPSVETSSPEVLPTPSTKPNAYENIASLWEQVLQELKQIKPLAYALIQPNATLASFVGQTAQVEFHSEAFLKLAKNQGRVTELEGVFQKVCGQAIRVNLTVTSTSFPVSPEPLPKPPASPSPVSSSPVSPSPHPPLSPTPKPSPTNGKTPEPPELAPTLPSKPLSEDDVAKAAAQIAKAFEGEIVELAPDPSAETPPPPEATTPAPKQPVMINRPAIAPVDDEEDIPF